MSDDGLFNEKEGAVSQSEEFRCFKLRETLCKFRP